MRLAKSRPLLVFWKLIHLKLRRRAVDPRHIGLHLHHPLLGVEPIAVAKTVVQDLPVVYLVETVENNAAVLLSADLGRIPETVEVEVMIEQPKAVAEGRLPLLAEDHEHLKDIALDLQRDTDHALETDAAVDHGHDRMNDIPGQVQGTADEVIAQENYQMIVVVRCRTRIDEEHIHVVDHVPETGTETPVKLQDPADRETKIGPAQKQRIEIEPTLWRQKQSLRPKPLLSPHNLLTWTGHQKRPLQRQLSAKIMLNNSRFLHSCTYTIVTLLLCQVL